MFSFLQQKILLIEISDDKLLTTEIDHHHLLFNAEHGPWLWT